MNRVTELKVRGVNVVLNKSTRIGTIYTEGALGNSIRNYLEAEGFMEEGFYLMQFKTPDCFNEIPSKGKRDDGRIFNATGEKDEKDEKDEKIP